MVFCSRPAQCEARIGSPAGTLDAGVAMVPGANAPCAPRVFGPKGPERSWAARLIFVNGMLIFQIVLCKSLRHCYCHSLHQCRPKPAAGVVQHFGQSRTLISIRFGFGWIRFIACLAPEEPLTATVRDKPVFLGSKVLCPKIGLHSCGVPTTKDPSHTARTALLLC